MPGKVFNYPLNVPNGIPSLNGAGKIPTSLLETNAFGGVPTIQTGLHINEQYLPILERGRLYYNSDMSEQTGIWAQTNNASQTDFADSWVTQAAYRENTSHADLDELAVLSLTLDAGQYTIEIATVKSTDCGILEVLHGATVIGTVDLYAAAAAYNNVFTFSYSPSVRTTAHLRFRINGKNVASSNHYLRISRVEIRKNNPIKSQIDVTVSRALATTYQNTSGKPMFVSVSLYESALAQAYTGVASANIEVAKQGTPGVATAYTNLTFIVLPGYYYKVTSTTGSMSIWIEWS